MVVGSRSKGPHGLDFLSAHVSKGFCSLGPSYGLVRNNVREGLP
jgi:hypothetical protein